MIVRVFKYIIAVLLFCYSTTLSAQHLSNLVKDVDGEPIPYVTIIFSKDSTTTNIIDYAISDDNGHFSIPKKIGNGNWFIAKALGYKEYKARLNDNQSPLEIVLDAEVVMMDEVVVKGNYWGVKATTDTIKYDANRYSTGSETSVGEVLAKMPGLEVSETGKISYGGKIIDKVLVDGKDILSSGDGLAINTLSADFIESADVLLNYQSNSMVDKFKKDKTVAININTNGAKRTSGAIEGGYGYGNKFQAKSSIISIKEPFSFSAIATANNVGEAVFSMDDYIKSIVGLDNLLTQNKNTFTLSNDEKRMLLPPDNTYDATNGAVSLGANYEKDKRFKFRGNLLYNGSMLDALSNSVQTYYDNDIENQADVSNQNRNHFITASLQETWKPNTKFELSSNTRLNCGSYSNKQYTNNRFADDSFYANELRDSKSYNVTQEFNANYKIGTGILYAYTGLEIAARDENYSLMTDSLLFSTAIPSLGYNVNDDVFEKRLSVDTEVGYILPIYRDINLNSSLSYLYNTIDYSYKIPISESITSSQSAYRANIRLEKTRGVFRFAVGGLVKWDDFSINATKGSYANGMVEPNASLSLVFNPKHKLSLGTSYNQTPYSVNHFSDTTRIVSHNHSLGKSEISNPFYKNTNISLQYFIFDLYSRTSLFVYSNYTHTYNAPLMNIQQRGITNNAYYSNGGETELFISKILVSKGLGFIPADIKLDASHTYTKTLSSINHILSTTSSNNTNVGLSVNSRFRSIVNFEMGTGYRNLYNESKAFNINSRLNEWGASVKMNFVYEKFNATVYCSYDNINTAHYRQDFTDIGFHIGYDFKRFGFRVSGRNLLNMDKMEWITTTSNELYTSDTYYRKIPGSVLLSLVYKF